MPVVRDASLQVRLLGPLEVTVAGRPVVVDTRKALAIVALIATEGRPFARDELAAMFWPDSDDDAARGALRRTLSALRAAVVGPGLVIGRSQVALDTAATWVDLIELERLAGSSGGADLEAAADLARGPFLAGFAIRDSPDFDDWQAVQAVRVERIVGGLLDRLSATRAAQDDIAGAVDAARRRVALDPLDEVGQRRLVELLAIGGDRTGAIRQYRELVALFDRELGVAPLRETTDLYDAIREDRLQLEVEPGTIRFPATTSTIGSAPSTAVPPDQVAPGASPLVGRGSELALLGVRWRASGADGKVVFVEGEAGIGKTRLADAFAGVVRAAGGTVLAAAGYPGESAIVYGPIAELLRVGLAGPGGVERLAGLDETARLEIGRLIELPASLRVASPDVGPYPVDGSSARVRLLDAIANALVALTQGVVPGVIWVDDLHFVDDPTREALAYLARRLARRSVLVLLAWRREDLTPAGIATIEELARLPTATLVVLPRLDRDQVAELVRALRPEAAADDAFIDAVAADSEGSPLHIVAALASDEPPGTIPRGIVLLLGDRIRSVSETAAQVLSAAAVIGRSFDLTTVRQSSGRSEEETVDAIEELIRRGIVRELPTVAGTIVRYDFAHSRMRDVAYESTSLARRRLLHHRTAEALASGTSGVAGDDRARFALIAAHEREAGRPQAAAAAFVEAADRAEAVFANREAIDHLASAIALGLVNPVGAHARIGELEARLGAYPAAIAALETAAALGRPEDMPAIEIALARVQRRRGDLAAAASHLAAAMASPDLSDPLGARAFVEQSVIALRVGDLDLAGTAATSALAVARRLNDPHLEGLAERLVGVVAQGRGDLAGALLALRRSLTLAADDTDPTAAIAASTALALALAASGDVDSAVARASDAVDASRRMGDRHLEAAVENHLADILHGAGRDDESMTHLKRAVGLFAEIGQAESERDAGIWALAAW